jgi:hypothetical protein
MSTQIILITQNTIRTYFVSNDIGSPSFGLKKAEGIDF